MTPKNQRDDCVDSVILEPLISQESKTIVWITARDRQSGYVLQSQALIGTIDRLQIMIRFHHVYTNDNKFVEVVAYDDHGDIFSDLNGFRFDWNILKGSEFVKIIDKPEGLKHPKASQTDVAYLKGLLAGQAEISVKINEPGYEHLPSVSVAIQVVDPFLIEPYSNLYLLPTSPYRFKLNLLNRDNQGNINKKPLALPNSQYSWSVMDSLIGKVDQSGLFISDVREGATQLLVVDQKMKNNTAESAINVVYPYRLHVSIHDVTSHPSKPEKNLQDLAGFYGITQETPSQSRILVEDRLYLILLHLSDVHDNRILMTENIVLENKNLFSSKFVEKIQSDSIGSQILFHTKQIQQSQMKIPSNFALQKIKSVTAVEFNLTQTPRLSVDIEYILTKPVKILSANAHVLLPYFSEKGQQWSTSAIGGSGVFKWEIADSSIASIKDSVTIRSNKVGITKLTVYDDRNLQNKDSITIEVALVDQLKWLEKQLELDIKSNGTTLSVIALDSKGRKFTNCTELPMSFSSKKEGKVSVLENPSLVDYPQLLKQLQEPSSVAMISQKHRFDLNPNAVFQNDLTAFLVNYTELMQNNFGICSQTQVRVLTEGLGRVRSSFADQDTVVESEFAEIAVYKELQTAAPDPQSYFSDLYSRNQLDQEFQRMDSFYEAGLITLTPGTQQVWTVTGGSNYWRDFIETYGLEWQIIPVSDPQGPISISVQKLDSEQIKQSLLIKCNSIPTDTQKVSSYLLKMTQSSKVSNLLLRPATHQTSIKVECGTPKSARLLWAQSGQNNTVREFLPSSRLVENKRNHFVLVGSEHTVKTLLLDQNSIAYSNTSSILSHISSSDSSLATVTFAEPSFEAAVISNTYAKRKVKFGQKPGVVTLQIDQLAIVNQIARIESGRFAFSAPPKDQSAWQLGDLTLINQSITDSLVVNIVQAVQIETTHKTLYLGSVEPFTVQIKHGSGNFLVTSNSSIINLVHQGNEIFVKPNKTGTALITVVDINLPTTEPAHMTITVSDIEKLSLWSPRTLIEEEDELMLIVSAFDSEGKDFDEDQYVDMRFSIETEMTGLIRKNGLFTVVTDLNTHFLAKGRKPGIYQLTAYTDKLDSRVNQGVVVSDVIKIEVFPLLEISPNELLLTPMMRYVLQIEGGPENSAQHFIDGSSIEIRFEIDRTDVATINQQTRELTAHAEGDAVLGYWIIQQKSDKVYVPRGIGAADEENALISRVVSKKQVPIRVRLVTSIEIPGTNRQIYTSSLIKLNALLKFNNEYFNDGIAPISFAWSVDSAKVLSLEIPQESGTGPNSLIQRSIKLRNNLKNEDDALFTTAFNSSSVYFVAAQEGDAKVHLQVALMYPKAYKVQTNWFQATTSIKVTNQLKISVNDYSSSQTQGTHMFLLPPNSIGHIKSNIDTKLRLGYSVVSVYDHTTKQTRDEEATSPIVKLLDNHGIQTFDKYGKVTVIIQEASHAFSDQVAMLNVFITDIFSLQVMNTYDSLNLPLGSSIRLPIHFQNEHANRFADNIEGIKIAFSVSHPKVVKVTVDSQHQEILLVSQGSGECNIRLFLQDKPHIFDVFKVKVSSLVRPFSPVQLHVGGQVDFKVVDPEQSTVDLQQSFTWKSSEPSILDISTTTGRAIGLAEGRAEIMLSNHVNAASLVHVQKVHFGQVEQKTALALNTDKVDSSQQNDLLVRIKLFFHKNGDEIMPSTQYEGVTLIHQNIMINCVSDQPEFVKAFGEVSELEGFFCRLQYTHNSPQAQMPRFVKITVSAYGMAQGAMTPLYTQQVAQFDVQLLSSIKVEKQFQDGLKLSRSKRSESARVFSSSDFDVQIDYLDVDSQDSTEYLKYRLDRADHNSNQYNLTVIVPEEVSRDFKANIILMHPYTKFRRVLPFHYKHSEIVSQKPEQPRTKPAISKPPAAEYENMESSESKSNQAQQNGGKMSILSYVVVLVFIGTLGSFIYKNWLFVEPIEKRQNPAAPPRGLMQNVRSNRGFDSSYGQSYMSDRSFRGPYQRFQGPQRQNQSLVNLTLDQRS